MLGEDPWCPIHLPLEPPSRAAAALGLSDRLTDTALRTALPHSLPSSPCIGHAVLIADAVLLWVHQALMTCCLETTILKVPQCPQLQAKCQDGIIARWCVLATRPILPLNVWPTHGIQCSWKASSVVKLNCTEQPLAKLLTTPLEQRVKG